MLELTCSPRGSAGLLHNQKTFILGLISSRCHPSNGTDEDLDLVRGSEQRPIKYLLLLQGYRLRLGYIWNVCSKPHSSVLVSDWSGVQA